MRQREFSQAEVYELLLKSGPMKTADISDRAGLPSRSGKHAHGVAYSLLTRLRKRGAAAWDCGHWMAIPGVEVKDSRGIAKRSTEWHQLPPEQFKGGTMTRSWAKAMALETVRKDPAVPQAALDLRVAGTAHWSRAVPEGTPVAG